MRWRAAWASPGCRGTASRGSWRPGELKPLPLVEGALRHHELYLVFADRDDAGPATRALADCLRKSCPGG
jgi:hypothetical protein